MALFSFVPFLFLGVILCNIMEIETYQSQNYSNILKDNNIYEEKQC